MSRNPRSELALSVDEIRPGTHYSIIEGGDFTETGTILDGPTYGEEGWFGAVARIDGLDELRQFDVYAAGVSCSPDGQWPDVFTVGEQKPVAETS